MSSVNSEVNIGSRWDIRRLLISGPLPLVHHLVCLGLALAVCYSFVGYYSRMAIEMERLFPADSRAGAFFMVLAVPFWMGAILSFRQIRLLIRHRRPYWHWLIAVLAHVTFFYFAPVFYECIFGLVLGVVGSMLFLPISLLGYAGVVLCVMGRDEVQQRKA